LIFVICFFPPRGYRRGLIPERLLDS